MALYSFCQYSIHNIEFDHDCYAILIVYQSMLMFIMSCVTSMVRPDVWGLDNGSLCFRACSGALHGHPKGGSPGGIRVVTSYTSVVLGYAGSSGYSRAPQCERGRRHEVDGMRGRTVVAFIKVHDVRVRCRRYIKR